MKFDTVFFGYDKGQVDEYIKQTTEKYEEVLHSQKERIFSLVDENASLNEKLQQYVINEQAISKSLVESQKLADEMKFNAEEFSRITLNRAKIFYATWQSYAKTMLENFSADDMKKFNQLSKKIEELINAFEGKTAVATLAEKADEVLSKTSAVQEYDERQIRPTDKTLFVGGVETKYDDKKLVNPIEKVEKASGEVIDLKELLHPEESLEDLCIAIGLIKKTEK